MFVSEFNKAESSCWYTDANNKAAIINPKNAPVDNLGNSETGFRWIESRGMRLYSCYWSLNTPFSDFSDFLNRLESSIRSSKCDVLVAGDFNAHHSDWGSAKNCKRGESLSDMFHATGLLVCNRRKDPTFNKGSILDITLATPRLVDKLVSWSVLNETTLSDHFYIRYQINVETERKPKSRRIVDTQKLHVALSSNLLSIDPRATDAEECAATLISNILSTCTTTFPPSSRRRSVHWWSPTIAALRKNANHFRRVLQRKKKRRGLQDCTAEEEAAKAAKRSLIVAIKKAKDDSWKSLCDAVERDPWGKPFKLIMGKLAKTTPIPEINIPGRMLRIVQSLFPTHRHRATLDWPPEHELDEEAACITLRELHLAARSLRSNASPGPDGIPTKAILHIARCKPGILLDVYNKCIAGRHFPKIWKKARLVLVRKGDKPLDAPSSYRPLCLLDSAGKLLEKIVDTRLRGWLDDTHGLDDMQFGFRKGRSTTDAVNWLLNFVDSNQPKSRVGMLTLDVSNAFNTASWAAIFRALRGNDIPGYLYKILDSYLTDRTLIYESNGSTVNMPLTIGVPQGSVLGPTLWNVLFDSLLKVRLPPNVHFLAYADDVALVAKAKETFELECILTEATARTVDWLSEIGLNIAAHKSEAVVFSNRRRHNNMSIEVCGRNITAGKTIRYLGVLLDSKLNFNAHAREAATTASAVMIKIGRILPNVSAATPKKRRLLGGVAMSKLLYGAPLWANRLSRTGRQAVLRVQRRVALRVASLYRTVSLEAALVLADMPPADLLVTARLEIYKVKKETESQDNADQRARRNLLQRWQERWDSSEIGRWTHRLIRNLDEWHNRTHGETDFHLAQAFSSHGCFATYLHRFGRYPSPECWWCGHCNDDAMHTIFDCDAWHTRRSRLATLIGVDINPDNVVSVILRTKENWKLVHDFIKEIMGQKETYERLMQSGQLTS